jgi:flagellar biosynthesis/type III secretory pathway protein FliH
MKRGILTEYLKKYGKEVLDMLCVELDETVQRELWTEYGREEGWKEGVEQGMKQGVEKGMKQGVEKRTMEVAKTMKNKCNTPREKT